MNKRTLVLGAVLTGLLGLTYWTWKQLKLNPLSPTAIHLTLDNAVESLDPVKAYSDDSLVVSAQVHEPLYQYHYLKRPYEIQPLLAEANPLIEREGTLYKIKIKRGVYFHDHPSFQGKARELMADDFVTQFKRLAMESLKSPGRSLFTGLIDGFDEYGKLIGEDWQKLKTYPLAGVEARDRWTLIISLKKPEPNLIYYLSLNFISPVPFELVEYYKNDLSEMMVGTGPYVYRGFNGKFFEMQKFHNYREDYYPTAGDRYANVQKLLVSSKEKIPFIDTVRFYVTEEDERWEKFLNHEIDLLSVPKTYIPKLYDSDGGLATELRKQDVKLKHFPILANRWYAFNMRHPVMGKNLNLRLAIAHAIDYTKYIQVISQNTNLRANSLLVPGIAGYRPTEDFRFKYDPDKALEYLKKAGFENPAKLPEIVYSTRGTQAIHLMEAEFIKEHLEAIGFKVKIEVLPFSDFLRKGRAGELMFFTDNWLFDYPDGENILQLLISSNSPGINKSGYSNAKLDTLYLELKRTTNIEQREKIFKDMETQVFEDVPWIPMMYESSFVLHYPEIKNFRKSSIIRNYIKYLKIEK